MRLNKYNMIRILLFIVVLFSISTGQTQNLDRVMIKGQMVSKTNDVEGITVYNTSSNSGTVTDAAGVFNIQVALHDQIEISALQFKTVTVIIDDTMIKNKAFTVLLTEEINTLDEVVILSNGLTGDLTTDLANVEKLKTMPHFWGDLRDIEFDNEHLDRADNALVKKGQFYNGVDFSRLLGLNKLMNNFLSKKKTTLPVWQDQKESDILAKYSVQFMSENYNIPWHQVDEFLIYLESKESSNKISSIQSEVQLLEFLLKESKVFLQKVNEN